MRGAVDAWTREAAAEVEGFHCAPAGLVAVATKTTSAPRLIPALRIPRLRGAPCAMKLNSLLSVPQHDAAATRRFQIRAELFGAVPSVGPDPDSSPDRRPATCDLAVDQQGLAAAENGRILLLQRVVARERARFRPVPDQLDAPGRRFRLCRGSRPGRGK